MANVSHGRVNLEPFKPALQLKGIAKEVVLLAAPAHEALPTPSAPSSEREASWVIAALKEALGSSLTPR